MRPTVALLLVLAGCGSAEAAGSSIDTVTASLKGGECADRGATGADSWFAGDLTVGADGKVTGTERWVLKANPQWTAHGGKDCHLDWTVTGTSEPCAGCAASLKLHGEPQRSSSDCPQELVYGRKLDDGRRVGAEGNPFDETYEVVVSGTTATVKYASSGDTLGTGSYDGGHLTWVSHHQCKWF